MGQTRQQLAEAFPPGEMLQEKLSELGMPIKEFALRCGKPEPTIHAVLQGRSAVTPDMAILFENVLDIPAHLWLNLQCQYDEYRARLQHDAELKEDVHWAGNFPFAEMATKGYFNAPERCSALEKTKLLLAFFGFAKPSGWVKYYQKQVLKAEFHLSLAEIPEAAALSAWLRYGEHQAEAGQELTSPDEDKLRTQIPLMQKLANSGQEDFLSPLLALCQKSGIRLVCTPQLCSSKAYGAARWLRGTPLIQVSDSFKRYDVFWFTFFHALGHILLHGKRDVFLEGIDYEQKNQKKEQQANVFAANCLIPRTVAGQLKTFRFSDKALRDLCQKEGLHSAFVIGRLHYHALVPQSVVNQYVPRVDLRPHIK